MKIIRNVALFTLLLMPVCSQAMYDNGRHRMRRLATTSTAFSSIDVDDSVVPNSSYMIYEGVQGIVGEVPATSRYVTFYTCNGDPIQKVEHHFCFSVMERKLDRLAPKPMPVAYQIKYWPAISIGFGLKEWALGDFIIFYDKNNNKIASYRYDSVHGQITVFIETHTITYNFDKLVDRKTWSDFPLNLIMLFQRRTDD